MASFTDNLPVFKEYVQQQPVEAMLQVGQTRQQRYDEGIQKIQSSIDKVAGMDVVRDVDKQYLQSKLNTLGGDLRKVAAGDFSNYQLVNSVGGMINTIGKDRNIQNAVGSTMRYRKGVVDMETAIKEGKSSPSNEYAFNKQAQEWLANPDIKASFNSQYKPYTNWKKNGLEVLKSLTKNKSITEDAFTIDSRGNIVIADAVVRKELAGISPEQVQQALLVGLTPADFQQMEMDGVYSYANLDRNQFLGGVSEAHQNTISFYEGQKKILENAKSSTTSVIEKSRLDDQISALNKVINNVSSDYENIAGEIAVGNLDAAKAQYFTRKSLDGFAKAFSYTEIAQTYEDSPFAKAAQWREEQDRDWKKFMLKYEQDERGLKLKEKENKLKEKELEGYGGLPVGVPQDQLPVYTLNKVVEEINTKKDTIDSLDSNFMANQGKDQGWLNQQKLAWEKSPTSVSPIVAEHFNMTERMRREALADSIMVTDIEKEAETIYGSIDDHIPNDPPVTYTRGNEKYTFSPKDFVTFSLKYGKFLKTPSPSGSMVAGGVQFDFDKARKELTDKEYTLFEAFANKNPSSAQKQLVDISKKYNTEVAVPYREVLNKIDKYTSDEVTKRVTWNQGVAYGLPTGNAAQKSTIATVLTQFADKAETLGGGIQNSPDFDPETARKLAAEDAKYSLTVVEGTERQPTIYELTASGESGSVKLKITPEEKNAVFGSMFNASPEVQAAKPYIDQMMKMGGYTTALTPGPSTPENSYLSKIDFPSVNIYGVKANIVTLSPNSGRYSIKLSIYDPVKKIWHNDIDYPKGGMIPENGIAPALKQLNDSYIYEILNETPATDRDLKRVEIESKKPL